MEAYDIAQNAQQRAKEGKINQVQTSRLSPSIKNRMHGLVPQSRMNIARNSIQDIRSSLRNDGFDDDDIDTYLSLELGVGQ